MERWHDLAPNWAVTTVLILVIALNLSFSYYGFSLGIKTLSLAIIPVLSMVYFYKKKIMANIFVIIFMLYFMGILFNSIADFSLSKKLSEAFFTGAYLLLIFVLMGKLKNMKFEGLVSWYLAIAFLINTYLIFQLFIALKGGFQDSVILTLAISKGIVLLVMAFLAFAIYLSTETKQSIVFLTMVCCFIFCDVLGFINTAYLYFWPFETVQKITQGIGLILAFAYVYRHQVLSEKIITKKTVPSISDQMSIST